MAHFRPSFGRPALLTLVLSVLTGCAVTPSPVLLPSSPSAAPSGLAVQAPAPSIAPATSRPSSQVRFRPHWAAQLHTDAALVQGCIRLSQQAFQQQGHAWVYAGHGTYRQVPIVRSSGIQCWNELQQVFLAQARTASQFLSGESLGHNQYQPNPVVLYDLLAARWASHCHHIVSSPAGLQSCLSPAELQPIADAKTKARLFLNSGD